MSSSSSGSSSASSSRRIRLRRQFQDVVEVSNTAMTPCRMRVEVVTAAGLPAEVFLYQRFPPDAQAAVWDHFAAVCSPVDLDHYPPFDPAEPPGGPSNQFFRHNYFDCRFPSKTLALAVWAVVVEELEFLLAALDAGDVLDTGEEFDVP